MRVGLDIGKAVSGGDGVGRFGQQLLRALASSDAEAEFLLFDLGGTVTASELRESFPDLDQRFSYQGHSAAGAELDVFHALTWRWPAGTRAPVLFALYDVTFLSRPEHHTSENRLNCLEGTLRAVAGDATFLTISEAAADDIRSWLGLSDQRLRVVPLAAAPDLQALPSDEARNVLAERWDLEPGFVLSVGTLEPRKNHRRLLEAHRHLAPDLRGRAPLVLAGGAGWKTEGLTDQEDLRWVGRVSDEELRALYSSASVFAYPSLEEGFGLPVLEAMACGAPVLTSDRSSLPEVAGDAAVLVDPTDVDAIARGLEQILGDADGARDLVERGHRRAAAFSWKRVAEETLALYGELAGSSP